MSRIHEALKKAEQERAAQGGPVQSNFAATPMAEQAVGEPMVPDAEGAATSAAVAPAVSTHASPPLSSFSGPFSLDALQARCATVSWSPDPSRPPDAASTP